MRSLKLGLLVATALCSATVTAKAGPVEVLAAVRSVTVFADEASVTREGEVDIPAGDSVLVLGGISRSVVRDSVIAKATAARPVQIGSVETRPRSVAPKTERIAELEQALAKLDEQVGQVEVRLAGFQAEQDFLASLGKGALRSSGDAHGGLANDPASWKEAWTMLREGSTEAADGLHAARVEQQQIAVRRQALAADLNAARMPSAGGASSLEIVVHVHADQATHIHLSVSYQTPGASWRPVYEARLDTGAGHMLLREEAIVFQRTGEDWNGIALTLSTVRPSGGVQAPVLTPLTVGLFDPSERPAMESRMKVANASGIAVARPMTLDSAAMAPAGASSSYAPQLAAPAPMMEADVIHASFEAGGLSVDYHIPGDTTVASDGTEKKVRIDDMDNEVVLSDRVVPKLEAKAYLQARFTNRSTVALMPGQVSLYLDGVFVGKSMLSLLRPTEVATMPFGPDDQVKVTYETKASQNSKEGWGVLGKTNVEARMAEFAIQSFHQKPIEITVLDQQPVSSVEGLKVDLVAEPQPGATDFEGKQGIVAWTATYKPGEEHRIRFGYTLRAPDGKQITGLPPR